MKKKLLAKAIAIGNSQMPSTPTNNCRMVQCATEVNRDAVRRESIDGVEHIVVTSFTLPDDIVMNGGLYPADEIANSFESLERTLAPVEHPTDSNGNFISASDPIAIHNFHAGAFNTNVSREDGRVKIEKFINVQEAQKTDRGKRLLDRINEIETSEKPRPIHTSVGVFLNVEEVEKPQTNAAGQEYGWIARNMVFDHDAILLDSIGAATPNQGVGVAVNAEGQEMEAERVLLPNTDEPLTTNEGGLTHRELRDQLEADINNAIAFEWMFVVDIVDDEGKVIFETNQGFYEVSYRVDDGTAKIVGVPLTVDRNVTYTPKVNSNQKGDAMKEMLINALKAAGITVNEEWTDEQLLAEYNNLQANQSSDDSGAASDENSGIADIVNNAVNPLLAKIEGLETKLNEKADNEATELAAVIVNSGKFPGLDAESAKLLPLEKLKEMAANCKPAHGLPIVNAETEGVTNFGVPTAMPK